MTLENSETSGINETKGQIHQIFCLGCKRTTSHEIKVSYDKSGEVIDPIEGWHANWSDHYEILECRGCSTISFRDWQWFSENQSFNDDGVRIQLYPLRNEHNRDVRSFKNVPRNIRRIYKEVIDCFNAESEVLCAAGLRALVEGICAEQKIIDGPVEVTNKHGEVITTRNKDLYGKISGLHEKGLLTKSAAQTLHEHRYLGNLAVHELARPNEDELMLAIEILEHTFETIYEMPVKASKLRSRRDN